MNAATLIFFGVKLQMKNLIIPWFKKRINTPGRKMRTKPPVKVRNLIAVCPFFQFRYFEDPIHANGK